MTDFNSGRVPQPGGAVIATPQGFADIAVAGDISDIQEVAVEEAAAAAPTPKRKKRAVFEAPAEEVAVEAEAAPVEDDDKEDSDA